VFIQTWPFSHNEGFSEHSSISVEQMASVKPKVQVQVKGQKSFSWHVPSCWHGEELHSPALLNIFFKLIVLLDIISTKLSTTSI
jgi:hypothetical protein